MAASFLLRRSGEITGPHPRGLLLRHLALGRIAPSDEVSVDGVEWQTVAACTDLAEEGTAIPEREPPAQDPAWIEERRKARLRWLDERSQPDRRGGPAQTPDESRSGTDRRANPAPPRKRFGPKEPQRPKPYASLGIVLIVVLIVGLAGAYLLWFVPRTSPRVRLLERDPVTGMVTLAATPDREVRS